MQKPSGARIGWGIVAVAAILATLFFGVRYPIPPAPEEMLEARSVRPVQFRAVHVAQDLSVSGDLAVADDLATEGGYALQHPAAGGLFEFGKTDAISTTVITPAAISTVTAYGCNVNSPSAAAQLCYAKLGATGAITLTIYNSAATPVAIVTPHAAGASYWIGGK